MDSVFQALKELGAGDFEHLNGSLIKHLFSTQTLLKAWGAPKTLCDAGLYHAAYGTAGFEQQVVSLNMRHKIASIIGKQAETVVYLYCSCDRDFVFSHLKPSTPIQFKDRFTGEIFFLSEQQSKDFCELTVANEMELVLASKQFKQTHGVELFKLFEKMSSFLSKNATLAYREHLSG